MQHPTDHIFHHTPDSLKAWFADRRLPGFRAKQVLEWVYRKGVADPTAMSNLAKRDRDLLAADMTFLSGETITHQFATDGTQKLLIEWDNPQNPPQKGGPRASTGSTLSHKGAPHTSTNPAHQLPILDSHSHRVEADPTGGTVLPTVHPGSHPDRQTECVMIPSEDQTKTRRTACISSQVGCPVGCRFCASGLGGLDGNLSAGRIVEQVWRLNQMLGTVAPGTSSLRNDDPSAADGGNSRKTRGFQDSARRDELPKGKDSPRRGELPGSSRRDELPNPPRITNIVFMGMGEPLANFAEVVHAVHTIAAPWGLGISARKITISTVGLPQAITRLTTELDLPVTLALSLHAPNDELRRELIPWAEYSTIRELLAACQGWFKKAGREITLEYILLGGLNDRPEHAAQLAGIAKSVRANVNLIRYNEVKPLPYKRPGQRDVLEFQHILRARGINTHIRASRGRDIAAACGQLRHETTTR